MKQWKEDKFWLKVPYLIMYQCNGSEIALWMHYKLAWWQNGETPFRQSARETMRLMRDRAHKAGHTTFKIGHTTVLRHQAALAEKGWIELGEIDATGLPLISYCDKWQENIAKFSNMVAATNHDEPPDKPAPKKPKRKPTKKQAVDTRHKPLMDAYQDALGYLIPNGASEGKAAKNLLSQYPDATVEQIIACYRATKENKDNFWTGKHLSLQTIHRNFGAWLQQNKSVTLIDVTDLESEESF